MASSSLMSGSRWRRQSFTRKETPDSPYTEMHEFPMLAKKSFDLAKHHKLIHVLKKQSAFRKLQSEVLAEEHKTPLSQLDSPGDHDNFTSSL